MSELIHALVQAAQNHQTIDTLFVYYLFSAIVDGMPAPRNGSIWYDWAYSTLHIFAANVSKFKGGNGQPHA